jgi:ectoine hydroxylase-related dioxygenase (phytanoyl-CoA dioxygenase family)
LSSLYPEPQYAETVRQQGFAILHPVLTDGTVEALLSDLRQIEQGKGVSQREEVYAVRNVLELLPLVRKVANSEPMRRLVEPILGPEPFPVRGIFFDKPPGANWKVPWHQDRTIAVKEQLQVPGFGPWSRKAGVLHVQPPAALLQRMLAIRLHLDDCGEENAPLWVIPGSHRSGKLSAAQIEAWRSCGAEVACVVPAGGALVMRPLLLHASSASRAAGHRRVVHLEFAAEPLPGGLLWAVE